MHGIMKSERNSLAVLTLGVVQEIAERHMTNEQDALTRLYADEG